MTNEPVNAGAGWKPSAAAWRGIICGAAFSLGMAPGSSWHLPLPVVVCFAVMFGLGVVTAIASLAVFAKIRIAFRLLGAALLAWSGIFGLCAVGLLIAVLRVLEDRRFDGLLLVALLGWLAYAFWRDGWRCIEAARTAREK